MPTPFELEFPAAYVDALSLPTAALPNPTLINRDPEPGETKIPVGTNVAVDIAAAFAGGTIVNSSVRVWINGTLAYDGNAGGFQTGFTGSATTIGTDTRRVIVDPAVAFPSGSLVTVRVAATSSTATTVDSTYTFTVEDIAAPQVASASARALKVVRVTFNEDVGEGALTAGNYVFTHTTIPSVDVISKSVALVDARNVDVTTDIELTPGASYTVTVANVKDTSGNAIVAPDNDASFVAFTPQQPIGRVFDLFAEMPLLNRQEDEGDMRLFLEVVREPLFLMLCEIDTFPDALDPDFAPEAFVDAMLADLKNPFDFDLSEIDKRRLVQILIPIRKQKGTDVGIANAVRFFMGLEIEFYIYAADGFLLGVSELGTEWVLAASKGSSALYSFDIIVERTLTAEEKVTLRKIVNYMKGSRTHYKKLIEPTPPAPPLDHIELGMSEWGIDSDLH